MADRLQMQRLLDVYAANWTLLLESRNLNLVALVRTDFEAIHAGLRVLLPAETATLTDLLLAHEALAAAVSGGQEPGLLTLERPALEAAVREMRELVSRSDSG
jgi:hypothetical protein